MKILKSRLCLILIGIALAAPNVIFACERCFGGAGAVNTPVTRGISMAMLLLLGVTGSVMSGVVAFFIYMWRRAKLFEAGKLMVTEQGNALKHPGLLKEIGNSPDNLSL